MAGLDPAVADCITSSLREKSWLRGAAWGCAAARRKRAREGGDDLRLHHRRRRVGRLGHGQPAVGQERQPGIAVRGWPGHAARQGAARDPRQLSRHRLFRPALSLDRTEGPYRGRLAQPARGEPPAVAQIRAGAGAGRRLVDQRPARQPRRALRLRRMGGARCGRLGLERGPALFQEGRARHGFRRAVARQGRPHPGAPHLSRHVERPRQGGRQRRSKTPGSISSWTRTANTRTAISRSRSRTSTTAGSRRRSAISTREPGCATI